ncbi:MAG: hypothetical protein CM15mP49_23880 [Actinomycetota bacterium]|nr:MAG: hypothetical protein CM15mP49_23880 [Actinomycetota bacterium]
MKVVLRADVDGLGFKGDIVSISDGYAQNKLIPQGLAFKATAGAEKKLKRCDNHVNYVLQRKRQWPKKWPPNGK